MTALGGGVDAFVSFVDFLGKAKDENAKSENPIKR
jgi:hypothetical protein